MSIKPLRVCVLAAAHSFRYGLVNRPPGIGAVPKGDYTYQEDGEGIDRVRHGIITYDHELSAQEVKAFELLPLSGEDGRPLEVPKFPVSIIEKVKDAVESLNYLLDEGSMESTDRGTRREIDHHNDTLEIFRKYAKSKHYDAEKALKELGYRG